jgi:hypothetical protein
MTDAIDPFKTVDEVNYLEELVGEGKKFGTVDDLAKGKFHADTMIETLKAEIASLKEANANGSNIQTLLDEIKKIKGEPDDNGGQPPVQSQSNPPPQNIEELVLSTLDKAKQTELVNRNRETVVSKLNEVWGADAGKNLQKTARELGVSVDYLNNVAQQSPKAFFTLTGLDANRTAPSGTTVPTSTVNFGGKTSNVRDAKFYRELKQANPKLYNDSKTKVQMHRDALSMGEAFFN